MTDMFLIASVFSFLFMFYVFEDQKFFTGAMSLIAGIIFGLIWLVMSAGL